MSEVASGGERTALKEWAVLCDAMARGDVVALVRKGGIREQRKGFAVRHERFLLYPTFFHEKVEEVAPRFRGRLAATQETRPAEGTVRLSLVADVAAVWRVTTLEALRAIDQEHGLARSAAESRFHYRGVPEVRVVAARVRALPVPVVVVEARRYAGCVSWVALDDAVDVAGASPVVDDTAFARRLSVLRAALGEPEAAAGAAA
ncbi:MAG TPA: DUF1802 family protein [Gemmatimonadaceae bacterium]|nr:DUF1802 family protein [Gemmatimonadaceae bacterium]